MLQKFILVLIITSLCIQISVCDSSTYHNLSDDEFVTSDEIGPTFGFHGTETATDCAFHPGVHEFNIQKTGWVIDDDGVDTVIGSYRFRDQSPWTNLSIYPESSGVFSMEFTVEVELELVEDSYSIVYLDLKAYANDSLGNWGESDVYSFDLGGLYPPHTTTSDTTTFDSTDTASLIPWAVPVVFFLAGIFLFTSLCYLKRK